MRERLRREFGVDLNSCLANLYRGRTDSMRYALETSP
jgi:hypothetical protein